MNSSIGAVKPDEFAGLRVGESAFGDESADEPGGGAEPGGGLFEGEQVRLGA
jgi:hypothetical protein